MLAVYSMIAYACHKHLDELTRWLPLAESFLHHIHRMRSFSNRPTDPSILVLAAIEALNHSSRLMCNHHVHMNVFDLQKYKKNIRMKISQWRRLKDALIRFTHSMVSDDPNQCLLHYCSMAHLTTWCRCSSVHPNGERTDVEQRAQIDVRSPTYAVHCHAPGDRICIYCHKCISCRTGIVAMRLIFCKSRKFRNTYKF